MQSKDRAANCDGPWCRPQVVSESRCICHLTFDGPNTGLQMPRTNQNAALLTHRQRVKIRASN